MNITKLTITPLSKGCKGFIRKNPSKQLAEILIKERLNSGWVSQQDMQKAIRKSSKNLPEWVNVACKILPKDNT